MKAIYVLILLVLCTVFYFVSTFLPSPMDNELVSNETQYARLLTAIQIFTTNYSDDSFWAIINLVPKSSYYHQRQNNYSMIDTRRSVPPLYFSSSSTSSSPPLQYHHELNNISLPVYEENITFYPSIQTSINLSKTALLPSNGISHPYNESPTLYPTIKVSNIMSQTTAHPSNNATIFQTETLTSYPSTKPTATNIKSSFPSTFLNVSKDGESNYNNNLLKVSSNTKNDTNKGIIQNKSNVKDNQVKSGLVITSVLGFFIFLLVLFTVSTHCIVARDN